MAAHIATVEWARSGATFVDHRYSRAHEWRFDGGVVVPASSSPHVVKVPMSNPANVDPEEAFIAALSSCHMLWFLGLAASAGYVIDHYVDQATGYMLPAADGKAWVAKVELQPAIVFSGAMVPDDSAVKHLHHRAHEECFLARSVKTDIDLQGSWTYRG